MTASIRPRAGTDLPALIDALAAQQPLSRYPARWPLPFAAELFIARDGELGAWVAESDGHALGHVSVLWQPREPGAPVTGEVADVASVTGLAADGLGVVSALFLDPRFHGLGAGRRLLDTAVRATREADLMPALDVAPHSTAAIALYERAGWREAGRARPHWLPADWDDVRYFVLPHDAPVG